MNVKYLFCHVRVRLHGYSMSLFIQANRGKRMTSKNSNNSNKLLSLYNNIKLQFLIVKSWMWTTQTGVFCDFRNFHCKVPFFYSEARVLIRHIQYLKLTNHAQHAQWSIALTGFLELQQPYSIPLCSVGSGRPAINNETSVHQVYDFLNQFEGKVLVNIIRTKVSLFHPSSKQ